MAYGSGLFTLIENMPPTINLPGLGGYYLMRPGMAMSRPLRGHDAGLAGRLLAQLRPFCAEVPAISRGAGAASQLDLS
jgi:hypothetical protein